jgi:predicted dehydrogenase
VVGVDPAHGLPSPVGRVDAVVVAVPPALHVPVALPWLVAGVPCLIEKPLAPTVAEARALAPFPHLQVGFVERWSPALRGRVFPDAATLHACRLARPAPAPARGLDVVRDLMVHDLDLLRWLWGDAPVTVARAWGVGAPLDVVAVELRRPGGQARLVASRVAGEAVRRLVVGGRTVDLRPPPGGAHAGDALDAQAVAFLAAVRGERPYAPGVVDGLEALALAERIVAAVGG